MPDGEKRAISSITSLHNYGFPSSATLQEISVHCGVDACPCGRGLPLMDARIGRTRDYLVSPAGTRVAAMDVDVAPLLPPGVVQYQLVQKVRTIFGLRAVPESDTADSTWCPRGRPRPVCSVRKWERA